MLRKTFYIIALLIFSTNLHADSNSDLATTTFSSFVASLSQANKNIDANIVAHAPWLAKPINGLMISKLIVAAAVAAVIGYTAKKAYHVPCRFGFCRCPQILEQGKIWRKQCKFSSN